MFDIFAETASGLQPVSSALASKTRTIRRFIISDLKKVMVQPAGRTTTALLHARDVFTRAGIHFDDFADLYETAEL
ncbi:Uncharacterised protein [Escherichia coli]|uniref:Uncharacterized protein n=1 Tax=Escherichia coli TaxID=562 RepID=A0A377KDW1_ECOLX|nr:Uncharacterised protein [Escherichia coli]